MGTRWGPLADAFRVGCEQPKSLSLVPNFH